MGRLPLSAMRRVFAYFSFIYGIAGTIFCGSALLLAAFGVRVYVPGPLRFPLLAVNFFVLYLTATGPLGPWAPVLRPTSALVRAARVALLLSLSISLGLIGFGAWSGAASRGGDLQGNGLTELCLYSLVLFQMVFFSAHWGLRPENVYPERWHRFLRPYNPLLTAFFKSRRLARPSKD